MTTSTESLWWADLHTPIGGFTFVTNRTGLVRVALTAGPGVLARLAAGLGRDPADLLHAPERLGEPLRQVGQYTAGQRREFDLALDWSGTSGFGRTVLQTLRHTVGFGQVVSYQDLAARAGRPSAARVVGSVMGSNPLPIVVPCHRVVAAAGLGGFGGGLDLKRRLLALEGVLPATLDFD